MKYEKATAEIVKFDFEAFMTSSTGSGDTPLGNFSCGYYKQGETCNNISWIVTGFFCGVYSNRNCQTVSAPPGSVGDGCYAWKLACSKF